MNKIILKGRLTNNVNVKYAENDNHTALAMWNMAVDDRSWKEEGSYHTDYIPLNMHMRIQKPIQIKQTAKNRHMIGRRINSLEQS